LGAYDAGSLPRQGLGQGSRPGAHRRERRGHRPRPALVIYARQTADEQATQATKHHNSVGFNGTDGGWLSRIAQKYLRYGRWYNEAQRVKVARALKKYHRQLLEEIAAKPGAVVLDNTTQSALSMPTESAAERRREVLRDHAEDLRGIY
jgi:hypothetical protein